jgi:hypothetical protein
MNVLQNIDQLINVIGYDFLIESIKILRIQIKVDLQLFNSYLLNNFHFKLETHI